MWNILFRLAEVEPRPPGAGPGRSQIQTEPGEPGHWIQGGDQPPRGQDNIHLLQAAGRGDLRTEDRVCSNPAQVRD